MCVVKFYIKVNNVFFLSQYYISAMHPYWYKQKELILTYLYHSTGCLYHSLFTLHWQTFFLFLVFSIFLAYTYTSYCLCVTGTSVIPDTAGVNESLLTWIDVHVFSPGLPKLMVSSLQQEWGTQSRSSISSWGSSRMSSGLRLAQHFSHRLEAHTVTGRLWHCSKSTPRRKPTGVTEHERGRF